MASVDWLENFWQPSYNGVEFNLCGSSLNSVNQDTNEVQVETEGRDTSSTLRASERREICDVDDDDSSVASDSGVSVLSIDYENNDISGFAGEKVDFSDIGDDDSTVASYDSRMHNVDESKEFAAIKDTLQQANINRVQSSNSRTSVSMTRDQSNISTKITKFESSQIKGNPDAESERKDLLIQLQKHIATHGRFSLEVASMVTRLADFHESVQQPEMSVTLLVEAMNIYSSKLGDHDEKVTETQYRLGELKEQLQDIDGALDYYWKALSMMTAMTGIYEEEPSKVRLNVAKIYVMKGFQKEAIKELKKSLRAFRDIHGDEHVLVSETVDQIADAYSEMSNHEKANSVRGELVKLKVALHGNKSIEVADALHKWAKTYMAIGDSQRALKIMKQAYVMFHDVQGSDAINTELTLEQIGYLYSEAGKEEKAIKAHTSVALIRKMRHGDNSVEVAKSYLTLGKSFLNSDHNDKAIKSFNKAMTIFGKDNDANNTNIENLMDTLHQIGLVHRENGKLNQALKAFTKELSIRKKSLPDDRLSIAITLAAIGGVYSDLKKNEYALQNYFQSLDLIDKVEGRRFQFADVLFSYGEVMRRMNHPDTQKCFIEAIQIYKANGSGEEDECMQRMLNEIPNKSDSRNIEPSLACHVLDNANRNRNGRFEV